MDHVISDLEQLGLDAARQTAGDEAVEAIEVTDDRDVFDDRPTYDFVFLIDQSRSKQRAGLVRTRIIQNLLAGLIERDDEHYPVMTIPDRTDWDKRKFA